MSHQPELRLLDLFSGIGGFSYAAEVLVGGFKTVGFCDTEPFSQRLLGARWPGVPIHPDIRTLRGEPDQVDVITAGFPCQDLSTAGKRMGFAGDRSVLFYEVIRLAREFRPQFLLLENVRGLLSHADGETFQEVLFQIAKAGFDAEWSSIPASDLGACHQRDRVWIVAYTQNKQCNDSRSPYSAEQTRASTQPRNGGGSDASNADNARPQGQWPECELSEDCGEGSPPWSGCHSLLNSNWRSYLSQPVLCRGDDGLSGRVDRLKALGNTVVPHVAAVPLRRIKQLHLTAIQENPHVTK